MVEKEYSEYALSKSEGWVRVATKFHREEEERNSNLPNDIVITKRYHTDFDTIAGVKYWDEIISGNDENAKPLYEKYGSEPENPYI